MKKCRGEEIHRHWGQSVYLTYTLTQTQAFKGKHCNDLLGTDLKYVT